MDVIETKQNESQTDPFKDRPPSPLYIPSKIGVDVSTQIDDGEVSVSTQNSAFTASLLFWQNWMDTF